jgi:hypothetical protein
MPLCLSLNSAAISAAVNLITRNRQECAHRPPCILMCCTCYCPCHVLGISLVISIYPKTRIKCKQFKFDCLPTSEQVHVRVLSLTSMLADTVLITTDAILGVNFFSSTAPSEFLKFDRAFVCMFRIAAGETWVEDLPVMGRFVRGLDCHRRVPLVSYNYADCAK